jgi:hypothetical protein
MGAVTPAVGDGAVPPSSPLSYSNNYTAANELLVLFNDYFNGVLAQQATVSYAGLYPGFAALYQMNVQIPTTVGPSDVYVEIVTDNADVEQVTIPVGGNANGTAAKTLRQISANAPKPLKHRKLRPLTPVVAGPTRSALPNLSSR